jgi:hypothetical protein
MKAIVQDTYGSPDVLELRDIDKPTVTDNDVLMRVHASSVDAGVWHLMRGLPYLVLIMGYGLSETQDSRQGQGRGGGGRGRRQERDSVSAG